MSTARINDSSMDYANGLGSVSSDVELLYVWIERDRGDFIREVGFNFSPNFRFDMKCTEDGKYELSCTENEHYCNVWKHDRINSLTALVGENGSGKTLLLQHLLLCSPVPKSTIANKSVMIYLIDGIVWINHNFGSEQLINHTGFRVAAVSRVPQTRIYMTNGLLSQRFSRMVDISEECILFTPDRNNIRFKQFYQKTTSVKKPHNKQRNFDFLQNELISALEYGDFEALCVLRYYYYLYTKKLHSSFVTGADSFAVAVAIPTSLLNTEISEDPKGDNNHKRNARRLNQLLREYKKLQAQTPGLTVYDPVTDAYISLIFELLYLTKGEFSLPAINRTDLRKQAEGLFIDLQNRSDSERTVISFYRDAFQEIEELGRILPESFILQNRNTLASYLPTNLNRQNTQAEYIRFCEFIDKLMRKKNSFLLKYVVIYLQPRSSGEQALQNLFSWLSLPPYFEELFGEKSVAVQDNVLLLLDEVDLYMHPEWQRKFLNLLSEELNAEYPDKKIQIVISTHSPLVLSDIPAENIIYLKHGGNRCTFASGPEENRTFGANIFAMLKDSFFMTKPLGEFAFSRIVDISKKLKELKANPDDVQTREQCRDFDKLIDLIGEPVVRSKLQKLYDEVFPDNSEAEHRRFLEELNGLYMSDDPEDRKKYQDLLKAMRSGSLGN